MKWNNVWSCLNVICRHLTCIQQVDQKHHSNACLPFSRITLNSQRRACCCFVVHHWDHPHHWDHTPHIVHWVDHYHSHIPQQQVAHQYWSVPRHHQLLFTFESAVLVHKLGMLIVGAWLAELLSLHIRGWWESRTNYSPWLSSSIGTLAAESCDW